MRKFIYFTLGLGALLCSCGHNESDKDGHGAEEQKHEAGAGHEGDIIELEAAKAKAAGVTVEKIAPADFYGVIKTSGKITSSSSDETTVAATASGIVSITRQLSEGAPVSAGTTLFSISSANLPEGELSRRNAIALQNAKAEYDRVASLMAEKLIPEKEYFAAKTAYENARLQYEAAGGRSSGGSGVAAPKGGYVKELLVKGGDFVNVGQPLMTITQNRHLSLIAELPQSDLASVRDIVSARFKLSGSDAVFDMTELGGRMASYSRNAENSSAFIPVTFEFNNAVGIVPGAYAEVYLLTSPQPDVISVPEGAITEEQGVYYVYVREDADCYRKQEVRIGRNDGSRMEILSGLKEGEEVVATGAIYIKLASASKVIPGHTHEH